MAPPEPLDPLARHLLDRLGRAGDRAAQRAVRTPCDLREQVVHDVVGVVVVHRDLVEDHLTLGLDVRRCDQRAGQHVAEHVDRHRQVLVEDPRVVAGVLPRGVGVELAADRVERGGDVHRRAGVGALEQQVLEEVRGPVERRALVP